MDHRARHESIHLVKFIGVTIAKIKQIDTNCLQVRRGLRVFRPPRM